MKQLLLVTSLCVALITGCDKKDDGSGKGISQHQNDELIREMNKVNSDLDRISTRTIHSSDPQSLNTMSVALQESRTKIADLESRIDSARGGDITAAPRATGERAMPTGRMSDVHFQRALQDIVKALETDDSREQLSAARSLRELQGSYPDRDFSMVLIPLMRVVKNEDGDGPVRIVAARALHTLDSERGDFAIDGVMKYTKDQSVRKACAMLSAERARKDNSARLEEELDKEEALAKR